MAKGRLAMRTCELGVLMLLGLLPTYAMRGSRPSTSQSNDAHSYAHRAAFTSTPSVSSLLRRGITARCSQRGAVSPAASLATGLRGRRAAEPPSRAAGARLLAVQNAGRSLGALNTAACAAPDASASPRPKVLITGGAGYIGSHLAVDLLQRGCDVVVFDNFENSSPLAIDRVQALTGKRVSVHNGDTRDMLALRRVFEHEGEITSVVHLAGLKAVGESVENPALYYDNNVAGSINLVKVMGEYGCKRMVFSSSATVYGDARESPIGEDHALSATSPYGRTKLWVEEMLRDTCAADSEWGVVVLRYFNPVGAHPSGMLGEDPKGIPNNLMPYITKVATGKQPVLKVFGDDYPTKDGTGVRDYLHIMDLSRGHVAALDMLQEGFIGSDVFNLGTGNGISVLEMVEAFREASRHPVPYEIHGRRKGDVAVCFADASKAAARLGWVAKHSLEDMCHDLWRFTQRNPDGYEGGAELEESAEPAKHGVAQPKVQLKSTKAKAL